jgi:hypothetical protein
MTQQEHMDDLARALDAMGQVVTAMSRKIKYMAEQPVVVEEKKEQDVFLDPKKAARILGVTTNTLAVWRCKGRGPKWRALNGNAMSGIRYHKDDVEAFLFQRTN